MDALTPSNVLFVIRKKKNPRSKNQVSQNDFVQNVSLNWDQYMKISKVDYS